ncbi:unnamed protein product [Cylicostephanus goldi]|uniref:Uncharacterized protein n=1 Tax=Cylicostephanus goldi TaxID=71465 RepID=A0A3P6SEX3_CYLGO|nr:unnamed protein product [Cylicostephanus goldi]
MVSLRGVAITGPLGKQTFSPLCIGKSPFLYYIQFQSPIRLSCVRLSQRAELEEAIAMNCIATELIIAVLFLNEDYRACCLLGNGDKLGNGDLDTGLQICAEFRNVNMGSVY